MRPTLAGTAMHMQIYIYMLACSSGPTTYHIFQMKEFKHFIKIECPHAVESESEGLLPDCSTVVKETRSEDDSS